MGLDFTIYYQDKNNPIEDAWDVNELCYGRKSWELVHFLNLPVDTGEDPIVKKEDWVKLQNALQEIQKSKNYLPIAVVADRGSYFSCIRKLYDFIDKFEENGWEVPLNYKEAVITFESWYDNTFDRVPTLGYRFATGYLEDFYQAGVKVLEYIDDDNFEVRAMISY